MDICEAHKNYDQELLDEIVEKVRVCSEKTAASANHTKRVVITADGRSVSLESTEKDFLDSELSELLEICRDKEGLWEFVITQANSFGEEANLGEKTKELLGWEPGKAVHSPDVTPEEFEDILEKMKNFKCDCTGQEIE